MVASLTGLAFREDRHVSGRHRRDPPVVAVGGGRGMGKTTALAAIQGAYGNRVPCALLDLGGKRYADGYGDPGSGRSPLLRILQDLQWELEKKVRRNGGIQFPRLSLALLSVATWQPDEEITLAQASKRLSEAGEGVARIARVGQGDRDDWASDWVSDVLSELAADAMPFPVNVLARATIRVFSAKVLSAGGRQAALAWHEHFDPIMPGDGYEALIALGRDFHLGGDFRARAETTLVAAFLADVQAGHRGLRRLARVGNPVVLLDNVHTHPSGLWLLTLVLGRRAQPEGDPLVIVATGAENLAGRLRGLVLAGGSPPPAALVAGTELTLLDQRTSLRMLDKADPRRLPPDLAHLIWRLAGGLPLGMGVITRAVAGAVPAAGHPGGPPLDGSAILSLPASQADHKGGASVTACLLEKLLPDPVWRMRLTILAAARDLPAAQALVAAHLNTDRDRLAAAQTGQLLRENGWAGSGPGPAKGGSGPAHFVPDPFLRTLLLDQLQRRTAHPTSTEVHTTLRDQYPDGGPGLLAGAEPARLYHCLALGDAGHVARRFSESFAGTGASAWLAALTTVVSAPHGARQDRRREVALGQSDNPGHSGVHRSVNRLLHAAWYLTDPLVAPDPEVANKITEELNLLAQLHAAGNDVLTNAGTSWRSRLLSWKQTEDQTVLEGEAR